MRLPEVGAWGSRTLRFFQRRLSRRLLAWFVLLTLGPLLLTTTVGYQRSQQIVQQLVEADLTAIARIQAQHVHHRVEVGALALKALASRNSTVLSAMTRAVRGAAAGPNSANRIALERHLSENLQDLGDFEAIALLTPEGRVVAEAGGGVASDIRPPSREWESSWSQSAGARPQDAPRLRIAFRVLDDEGRWVGYLAATVKPLRAGDFLEVPAGFGSRIAISIVDQTGRPVYLMQPPPELDYTVPLPGPLVAGPPWFHRRYRDAQGVEQLGTLVPVPASPWRLLIEVPAVEALGGLKRLRIASFALALAFMVVLLVTGSAVAQDIVSPLRRLVDAAQRVGQGDLAVRVDVKQQDELGELGRAFNDMTGALAKTNEEVRALHRREIERAAQLATVGELASGVVHEIRNPVVGIASGLDLVRRHAKADAQLEPIMDEMARQLSRIEQTLHGLLSFARPAQPTLTPINGNHVVERAVRLVQPTASRQGVEIEVVLAPLPPRFLADEELLQQALVNLLMNAVQATAGGKRIEVTTRAIGAEFEIAVADAGHGIPAVQLANVFKPFFTTRHTGTGLGLPITQGIIDRHGGRLTLESQEGVGTTARIRLPVRAALPSTSLAPTTGATA